MKIGLFMDDYFPSMNGVIYVMDNYAKRLGKVAEVVVVVPYVDKEYKDDFPYRVIRVKSKRMGKVGYSFSTPWSDKGMCQRLLDEKFDIIHIHSPFIMGRLGLWIGEKANVPVVGTIHTRFSYEFKRIFKGKAFNRFMMNFVINTYNRCDELFTVNEAIKRLYIEEGIKRRIRIVPNATEMVPVRAKVKARNYINETYKIDEDARVLLFVGRINIVKNILFLVESLKEVRKSGIKFVMLFVGTPDDIGKLRSKIRECELEDYVQIIGKITDRDILSYFYVRADLFLFPSTFDTSSLVQVEAASQKTPTMFIEDSPTASAVTNGVNGFITKANPKAYGKRIVEVLNDEALYKEVSENAYRDLYKTWDDAVEILEGYYEEIVK